MSGPHDATFATVHALCQEMAIDQLDALVVPSEDPHGSEYPAAHFKRRAWVTGFDGSAGTVVVLRAGVAYLFVDPRYWQRAESLQSPSLQVVRLGDLDAMTVERWLATKLDAGARVGVDPQQFSVDAMATLAAALTKLHLVHVERNPVDAVWGAARPPLPASSCWVHPLVHAGRTVSSKLTAARDAMAKRACAVMVVSALDEVMWTLNLRGADSVESPVFYAFLVITHSAAHLYAYHSTRVSGEVRAELAADGVDVLDSERIAADLAAMASAVPAGRTLWVDRATLNHALWAAVQGSGAKLDVAASPLALWKAVKNEAEQVGMRECHVRDAVAKTRFLAWIEDEVQVHHNGAITEVQAAARLLSYRQQEQRFVGYSFDTIMGYNANGADIHYHPNTVHPTCIGQGMLLIDSGGHYLDGTTDVTRTVHLGTPTEHQRRCYTRVLQGHVDMARAVFPRKVKAQQLDLLARLPLHRDGLDYLHGTGHGVGAFLNVHEYPVLVSSKVTDASDVVIEPGMIFSDEPGYYETGAFGIRIESLLLCSEAPTPHRFHHKQYLRLEQLTVIPFCRKLIDVQLLSRDQIDYIDSYHARCRALLLPALQARGDARAVAFLMRETEPLESVDMRSSGVMSWWSLVVAAAVGAGVVVVANKLARK